jgi:hypothetical protein
MRRLLIALAVVAAALGLATPASAGTDSRYRGGCSFTTEEVAPGDYRGVLDIEVLVFSIRSPTDNPVSATVTCRLYLNDAELPDLSLTASGTVAVAGAREVTYEAGPWDLVHICTIVDYTSDDTPTSEECWHTGAELIPPEVIEILDVLGENVFPVLDENLCPELAARAGTYGPVTIEEDGDVYVAGEWFWDCPPLGT